MQAIIYDLDDTLYATSSLSRVPFEPFFKHFRSWAQEYLTTDQFDEMVEALWTRPIDDVLQRFPLPLDKIKKSLEILNSINIQPQDLQPTSGLALIPRLNDLNILVTSGIPQLQWAKINALGVAPYFSKIIIDNPLLPNSGKQNIFQDLLITNCWDPKMVLVVGDNPQAEILAAHNLGMTTAQIARPKVDRSPFTDWYINDLYDLSHHLEKSQR